LAFTAALMTWSAQGAAFSIKNISNENTNPNFDVKNSGSFHLCIIKKNLFTDLKKIEA
jgi:hypothetical protein